MHEKEISDKQPYALHMRGLTVHRLDILFSSNSNIRKSLCGHTNFYECCDLMEKVYLT